MKHFACLFLGFVFLLQSVSAQHSVAREWNEALLFAIRKDLARPPVQARNIFHFTVALYDAWAVYDTVATTYLLGKNVHGYTCPFSGTARPADVEAAREEAMSYAAYRLLKHRYQASPGASLSLPYLDSLMAALGYDKNNISLDYTASPAGVGNYLATFLINYGYQDQSNEAGNYANQFYKPANIPLIVKFPGDSTLTDPNRWQPLTLDVFIDQNGNVIPLKTPPFLCPEWGSVYPFALSDADMTVQNRDSHDYKIYHLPAPPPSLDTIDTGGVSEEYKWTFELVSAWSSHMDPADTTMWDISPASIGNVQSYPTTASGMRAFYDFADGGDNGAGYSINPATNLPYQPQLVRRGDYVRVLAEFWADGPDSETPPGHWFTVLNYVSDHPLFEKKFKGSGDVLPDLEWDVKAYFALGGGMHDAAITAWGIKGYVDYVRPISAIRYMADKGQSSDTSLPNYHPAGITLRPGLIEQVTSTDPLAGPSGQNIGKIKLYAWKGPAYIADPKVDVAGVDWILAENWMPYQRPTFVTPPFGGFISGHSTYSSTAAEIMTLLTGDPYFPGGFSQFLAKKNEFLVFEEGPSANITLQWAKYRDASDQCSLSRIWGGIHPPADDIPGRIIGKEIGIDAFALAEEYYGTKYLNSGNSRLADNSLRVYPNPADHGQDMLATLNCQRSNGSMLLMDVRGLVVYSGDFAMNGNQHVLPVPASGLESGLYILRVTAGQQVFTERLIVR